MILRKQDGWTEHLKVGDRVIFDRGLSPLECCPMVVIHLNKTCVRAREVKRDGSLGRTDHLFWRGPSGRKVVTYNREGVGSRGRLYPYTDENVRVAIESERYQHWLYRRALLLSGISTVMSRIREAIFQIDAILPITLEQAQEIAEILGVKIDPMPVDQRWTNWPQQESLTGSAESCTIHQ